MDIYLADISDIHIFYVISPMCNVFLRSITSIHKLFQVRNNVGKKEVGKENKLVAKILRLLVQHLQS